MRRLIVMLPMLLLAVISTAQQKTVTGTVTAKSDRTPLQGVSVQVKNKTALTNEMGKFSIEAAPGDELTLTFVGRKSISLKVTAGTTNYDVEMEVNTTEQDVIVVTGYT